MPTPAPDLPSRIETGRLYLRPYRAGDGPLFHAAGRRNRAHLATYESDNVLLEAADERHAETLVRELAGHWAAGRHFFLGIFERNTDAWVGQIYIGPARSDAGEFAIGFVVDVDHEGRGYVTEAVRAVLRFIFEHLKAHRVRSDCDDTNERSWRVLERCGFVREEHSRERRRGPDGSVHGDYRYGLLRRDFESLDRSR